MKDPFWAGMSWACVIAGAYLLFSLPNGWNLAGLLFFAVAWKYYKMAGGE
jgi:hypothetical protein